jgi:hypothetical protein
VCGALGLENIGKSQGARNGKASCAVNDMDPYGKAKHKPRLILTVAGGFTNL